MVFFAPSLKPVTARPLEAARVRSSTGAWEKIGPRKQSLARPLLGGTRRGYESGLKIVWLPQAVAPRTWHVARGARSATARTQHEQQPTHRLLRQGVCPTRYRRPGYCRSTTYIPARAQLGAISEAKSSSGLDSVGRSGDILLAGCRCGMRVAARRSFDGRYFQMHQAARTPSRHPIFFPSS
jgi:hypothetical protein